MKMGNELSKKLGLILGSFVLFIFLSEILLGFFGFNYYPVDINVSISEKDRMFRLNSSSGYYETAKERLPPNESNIINIFAYQIYQNFTAKKSQNTYRIFILGGSSIFSIAKNPYYSEYVKRDLESFYPDKKLEIVFVGIVGHGTNKLLVFTQEILEYQPDLIILYSGHNEFMDYTKKKYYLENRGMVEKINENLEKFRIYQLLSKIILPIKNSLNIDNKNIEPIDPSEWIGDLNQTQKQIVYENYKIKIEGMIRMAKNRNVKFMLATVSYNHLSPPVRNNLLIEVLKKLNMWTESMDYDFGRFTINFSREKIEEVVDTMINQDNMEELNEYKLGLKYYEEGNFEKAREHFERGLLLEDFPERANTITNKIVRELAKKYGIPLADVESAVLNETEHNITTYKRFSDLCHLNTEGKKILINTLLVAIKENKLIT